MKSQSTASLPFFGVHCKTKMTEIFPWLIPINQFDILSKLI